MGEEAVALAQQSETPLCAPLPGTSRGRAAWQLQESILALKLRKAGHSYRSIAETLSEQAIKAGRRPCSPERANRIVLKALQGLRVMQEAEAMQLRDLELERLDEWQLGLSHKLAAGDPKAVLAALALQGRRLALQGMPLASLQGGSSEGRQEAPQGGESVPGTGLGYLAYAELRVGLPAGASGQGAEALRALVSEAMRSGAMRRLPAPGPEASSTPALPEAIDVASSGASPGGMELSYTGPEGEE